MGYTVAGQRGVRCGAGHGHSCAAGTVPCPCCAVRSEYAFVKRPPGQGHSTGVPRISTSPSSDLHIVARRSPVGVRFRLPPAHVSQPASVARSAVYGGGGARPSAPTRLSISNVPKAQSHPPVCVRQSQRLEGLRPARARSGPGLGFPAASTSVGVTSPVDTSSQTLFYRGCGSG